MKHKIVQYLLTSMMLVLVTCVTVPEVPLFWQPCPGEVSYQIYRSDNEVGPFVQVGETMETNYVDILPGEGTYHYELTAMDVCGNKSDPSSRKEVKFDNTAPPVVQW